jgi:hypothetical protein
MITCDGELNLKKINVTNPETEITATNPENN